MSRREGGEVVEALLLGNADYEPKLGVRWVEVEI